MGSVHPYKTVEGKRYLVRFRKPDNSQGSKRGFRTKREAELWLAELATSRSRGQYIDPQASRVTVATIGADWLEAKRTSMKPSSFAPVEAAWRLRVEPKWGKWPIAEIKFTDVKAWVSALSRDVGPTVSIRTFGVLAGILDDAVHDDRIARNPARAGDVGLPRKTKKRHAYLSNEQVFALSRAAGGSKGLIVLVLAYTGMRWGELTALRVQDIDFKRRRILIDRNAVEVQGEIHLGTTKSHRARVVPVAQFLLDRLAKHVANKSRDSLVFPGPTGDFMRRVRTSNGSKSWFKTALATAGLPSMAIHDLRHTAASLAVQSGAHVKTIQRMLGHASGAMTLDIYADLFDRDLDDLSAALDARLAQTELLDDLG